MIVAVIVTAVAVLANWWSRLRHDSRLELVSKPLATAGAIAVAATAGGPRSATALGIIALALCLIGDIALLPAVDQFIVGLAAFLLGHIGFIAMFAALGFDRWPLAGVGLAGCALALGTVAVPIMGGASAKGMNSRSCVLRRHLGDVHPRLGHRELADHDRGYRVHHQ